LALAILKGKQAGKAQEQIFLRILNPRDKVIFPTNLVHRNAVLEVKMADKFIELAVYRLFSDMLRYIDLLQRFPLAQLENFAAVPRILVGTAPEGSSFIHG